MGPFWLLLISIFLNMLIVSWHSFICVAWSLVLPLCLSLWITFYLICASLWFPHFIISGCCFCSPLTLCFESWINLSSRLGTGPRIQDWICLPDSFPRVLDASGRQRRHFGRMHMFFLSTSLVLIPGPSFVNSNFPQDMLRNFRISELSSFSFILLMKV